MLGHGNFIDRQIPCLIDFFATTKMDNVFLGSANCIAITSDNKVYAWGKNSSGMLGVPTLVNQNILVPTQIQFDCDDEFRANVHGFEIEYFEIVLFLFHSK